MTKIFAARRVRTKIKPRLALPRSIAHIRGAKSVTCSVFIFKGRRRCVLHGNSSEHLPGAPRVDNPGAATEKM
ncbi:MAG: hypothetical protein J7507_11575 [Pseudoxanthomonas sp.]|nr:hypothetical protein [Pseudoxanthomonas sp.]